MSTSRRKGLVVTLFVLMMLVRADRPGYVKASAGTSSKHATFVEVKAHGTGVRLHDGGAVTEAMDSTEAATKDRSKANLKPISLEMRKTIASVSLVETGAVWFKNISKEYREPLLAEMRDTSASVSLAGTRVNDAANKGGHHAVVSLEVAPEPASPPVGSRANNSRQSEDEARANRDEPIIPEVRDAIASVSLGETGVKVAVNKGEPQAGVRPGVASEPASSPAGSRANDSSSPSGNDVVVNAGDGVRPKGKLMALETPDANVVSSLSEAHAQVVANSLAGVGVTGNLSALGANASANASANATVSLVQTLNASASGVVARTLGTLSTELGQQCAFSDNDDENKAAFPAKDQGIRALQDCIAKLEEYQTTARSDQQISTEENEKYKTAFIDALHRVTQVVKGDKKKFFEDTRENPNDRGKRGGVLILGNEFMEDEDRAEKDLLVRLGNIREEVEKLNPEKLHTFTVKDHPGPTEYHSNATLSEFDRLPQWVSASQKKREQNNNSSNQTETDDENARSNVTDTDDDADEHTDTDDDADEHTKLDDDDDDERTRLGDDDDDEHTKLDNDSSSSDQTKLDNTSSDDGLDDAKKLGY